MDIIFSPFLCPVSAIDTRMGKYVYSYTQVEKVKIPRLQIQNLKERILFSFQGQTVLNSSY